MDNNKFFRVIWRINAILMLLASVLIIFTIAYDELYRRLHQPTYLGSSNFTTYEMDEDSKTIVETRWGYGGLEEIPGAPSWVISLRSELLNEDGLLELHFTRNLLFINAELGNSWLLSDGNNIIWNYEFVTTTDGETAAVLYDISNCMNNRCTEWSETAIYLSHTDGSGLTRLIDRVSRRIDQVMLDDNYLAVFYVQDEVAHATKVSLIDLTVIEDTTLAPVK